MANSKKQPNRKPDSEIQHREERNEEGKVTTIELPDVEDIPGQEHIKPPRLREMEDTTISSDDEEGKGIWEEDIISDPNSNVSTLEKKLLDDSLGGGTYGEATVTELELDTEDNEGDELEEAGLSKDRTGSDLDEQIVQEQDEEDEGQSNPDKYPD